MDSRLEGTTKGDVAFLFKGEVVSFSFTGHSGKSAGVLSMDRLASISVSDMCSKSSELQNL